MGMFDSVFANCPSCGTQMEFQSKADACLLRSYRVEEVPLNIAVDLNGEKLCCDMCGTAVTLRIPLSVPMRIQMKVGTEGDDEDL